MSAKNSLRINKLQHHMTNKKINLPVCQKFKESANCAFRIQKFKEFTFFALVCTQKWIAITQDLKNVCSKFRNSKNLHECKDGISSCFSEKRSFHTDDRNKVCLRYVLGKTSQELRVGGIYVHIHCKQASPFCVSPFL